MRHKHHIVPRHAGGTDHPDNLVELTVAEHAEAHWLLWSLYKRDEDRLAALCLEGQAKDPEALRLKCKLGGLRVAEMIRSGEIPAPNEGRKQSASSNKKRSEALKGRPNTWAMKAIETRRAKGDYKIPTSAKRIETPYGTFEQMKLASEATGVSLYRIRKLLKDPNSGWRV